MPGRGGFDGLIDGRIRPEGQRIIVPGQFEVPSGLSIIGQSEVAPAHAKLQVRVLRVNAGGFLIAAERLPVRAGALQRDALSS